VHAPLLCVLRFDMNMANIDSDHQCQVQFDEVARKGRIPRTLSGSHFPALHSFEMVFPSNVTELYVGAHKRVFGDYWTRQVVHILPETIIVYSQRTWPDRPDEGIKMEVD
jgi:hypothetical protein